MHIRENHLKGAKKQEESTKTIKMQHMFAEFHKKLQWKKGADESHQRCNIFLLHIFYMENIPRILLARIIASIFFAQLPLMKLADSSWKLIKISAHQLQV